ncbi:hypothetical protein RDI58_000609 [Solanum bulbocastanum]|uniref:Uncharacterized protein n=1 Tax=Solanum bulbocastanum TaxID=147425 RepID=A0AAN8UB97_SOLBU
MQTWICFAFANLLVEDIGVVLTIGCKFSISKSIVSERRRRFKEIVTISSFGRLGIALGPAVCVDVGAATDAALELEVHPEGGLELDPVIGLELGSLC